MTSLVLLVSNDQENLITISNENTNQDTDDEIEVEEQQENDDSSIDSTAALLRSNSTFKIHNSCLYLTDCLLSNFIFAPIVCIYWYCSWTFLDKYFLKERPYLSNYLSLFFGLAFLFVGYLLREELQYIYTKLKQFGRYGIILRFLMRTFYAYFYIMAIILQWRAIWNLYVFYLFDDISTQISIAIASMCYFCLTRSTRTVVSNPYFLYFDDTEEYFISGSRHKIDAINSTYIQYIIDFLMIEIVECFIMNFIWFGVQNYFDSLIFPDNCLMDLATSFTSSHLFCLVLLLAQRRIFKFFSGFSLVPRLFIEDTVNTLMIVSCVLYWKFYWDLCDYLLQDSEYALEFYLAGHFVSFFLSVLTFSTDIMVGPGIDYLDGEAVETKAYFEISYASQIYQVKLVYCDLIA